MALILSEYHRPQDLSQALELLARPEVCTVPLAGGTDLLGRRDRSIEAVVDLQNLGLAYIRESANTVRIGAMATLAHMALSPLLRELAGGLLARTAHSSAPGILRNQATLGGTLVAVAGSADLPPALLVLDAEVVLRTPDEHRLSLAEFYAQGGKTEQGELLTEVRVPRPAEGTANGFGRLPGQTKFGTRTTFHKVGRTPSDSAIVCVAAALTLADGVCQKARLAVGGIGPVPVQLTGVAAALEGQALTEAQLDNAAQVARESVTPITDFRASGEYRREMVSVLVRRALRECRDTGEES